jgi:hypothetical protein
MNLGHAIVLALSLAVLAPAISHAQHPTSMAERCTDAFQRPPFRDLRLVEYRNSVELSKLLQGLLGLRCTLDELAGFLDEKGATIDRRTEDIIYSEVTLLSKLLHDMRLALPTSITARIKGGRIVFIDASVSFF